MPTFTLGNEIGSKEGRFIFAASEIKKFEQPTFFFSNLVLFNEGQQTRKRQQLDILNMRSIFNVAACVILAFTNVAVAGDLQTNTAPASAAGSGGLTHEQLERVRAAYDNIREQTSTNKINMNTKTTETTSQKAGARFPVVPTTKILAIGHFTSPPTPEQIKEYFPKEVPATLKLYLEGKIDQWWVRQDQTGPVFLMNVTSIKEADEILEKLPLGQAKLMRFDYTELGPLTPLHLLLTEGWARGNK